MATIEEVQELTKDLRDLQEKLEDLRQAHQEVLEEHPEFNEALELLDDQFSTTIDHLADTDEEDLEEESEE